MKITYIYHSGFFVETDLALLLFDYYMGDLPEIPSEKPLYIFSSHSHGDHFSRKIFDLARQQRKKTGSSEVHFILSDDIAKRQVPEEFRSVCEFLSPDAHWADDILEVRALRSNDLGIAFILNLKEEGKWIYHAGDLNNWWWEGDKEDERLAILYHHELEKIKGMKFDAAFIPLDPRIKGFDLGIKDFFRYADADVVFPMHFGTNYEIIDRFLSESEGFLSASEEAGETKDIAAKIVRIREQNQLFQI